MPRVVDATARSEEIINAAIKILSEGGFVRLTLSNLAKELGGSMRLVTHYYRDRPALIEGILAKMERETDAVRAELDEMSSAGEGAWHVLNWFLLPDALTIREEKVRIALLVHKDVEPEIAAFFDAVETTMRDLLAHALTGAVDDDLLEPTIDLVRIWTSGLMLSVIEHPDAWPLERQQRSLEHFMRRAGIAGVPSFTSDL